MPVQQPLRRCSALLARAAFAGLVLASVCLPASAAPASPASLPVYSQTVTVGGKSYTAQWVAVDLHDPYLRLKPVTASAGIGHVEPFAAMMERSGAVAGVNGAFFDAYEKDETKRYPNGLLISSGETVHSGVNQAVVADTDKRLSLLHMQTKKEVRVTHNGQTYAFNPWGVNKYYGAEADDQIVWYTDAFGSTIDFPNATKIVIEEGRVTAITEGAVEVPADGQVCMVGRSVNNKTYVLPSVHVGDAVQAIDTLLDAEAGGVIPLLNVDAALGAGPLLIKDGSIAIDVARDGFTDPKITKDANVRSFVGIDASKRLVMGTLSAATISGMAQALLKLGLTDAMNVDGGASSALFANGSVLTAPGRLLSNALVVERLEHAQIQVVVNGQFVNEFRGFLLQETSMVPMRGILERIGAEFRWDGAQRTLSVKHGSNELILKTGDPVMQWNGQSVRLPEAPVIVDGHIYMPLRAVAEALDGEVQWDPQLFRASLAIGQP